MLNEALRLIRVIHDYKSSELAKVLGISPSYLSEIETGKKQPSLELLKRYSAVFNLRTSTLMFFSEELEEGKYKSHVKEKMRGYIFKLMKKIEKQEEDDNENGEDL